MLQSEYICGSDLTIADISLIASLSYADAYDFDFSPWERISRWKKMVPEKITDFSSINDEAMKGFRSYIQEKIIEIQKSESK